MDRNIDIMNTMMENIVNQMPVERREALMIQMLPMMLDGVDLNAFIPRILETLLETISVDQLLDILGKVLKDKEEYQELLSKLMESKLE